MNATLFLQIPCLFDATRVQGQADQMPQCSASCFVGNERATANLVAKIFTLFRWIAGNLDCVVISGTCLDSLTIAEQERQILFGEMAILQISV
jgi:hypothetical protein